MTYHFSEAEEQAALVEHKLQPLKREYQAQQMPEEQLEQLFQKIEEAKNMEQQKYYKTGVLKFAAAVVALVGAFILLPNTSSAMAHAMEQIPIIGQFVKVVTFRDYKYESERQMAEIKVPEIKPEGQAANSEAKENLESTAAEINAEIQTITDNLIKEFEDNLKEEDGYQDLVVKSEVLTTTQEYFTLKLICFQALGSGYEWNYFYTIDLKTGERLKLKDIFVEGADFITPISENIKQQMQNQMAVDENVIYWLDDEIEEWNFKTITEETSFYLNENGNVVIGFNEGDVAPMYMGTVEFEIPAEVLEGIRKEG